MQYFVIRGALAGHSSRKNYIILTENDDRAAYLFSLEHPSVRILEIFQADLVEV